MDTDDLSVEVYEAVIIEAEKFDHNLTPYFGMLASSCKNEAAYIQSAKELIDEIAEMDDDELSDLFFGDLPDKVSLHACLERMRNNIIKAAKIPLEKRRKRY